MVDILQAGCADIMHSKFTWQWYYAAFTMVFHPINDKENAWERVKMLEMCRDECGFCSYLVALWENQEVLDKSKKENRKITEQEIELNGQSVLLNLGKANSKRLISLISCCKSSESI